MPFDAVVRARAHLPSKKAGGSDDKVVYEMIRNLPLCVVVVFWRLFDARYRGESFEDLESWRSILLVFLQKVRDAKSMKDYRVNNKECTP